MKRCFVGFDTSNYTTSVAVYDGDGRIVANRKAPLPVKAGERGLRQSDAVFEHVRNLPMLMSSFSDVLGEYTPVAVGVSVRPRDAEDSYMPCFLSGKSVAYAFAAASSLPVFELSHQSGHIMAALYSSECLDLLEKERFLAFHVSGGTTEAVIASPTVSGFDVELVGNTADINAGQAIDRVGVLMGLSFPCGAALEALATQFIGKPYSHSVTVKNGVCSLSGVENIGARLYEKTGDKTAVAAFVFDFIGRTLQKMCKDITASRGNMPTVFAGGVMSNKIMRERLSAVCDAHFCAPEFSADNAAGIALLCRRRYLAEVSTHE